LVEKKHKINKLLQTTIEIFVNKYEIDDKYFIAGQTVLMSARIFLQGEN
jgi:hypothetical protein